MMRITYILRLLFVLAASLSCSAVVAQSVKVACVGNSVTFGYGIENRETNAYPAQLQQLLGDGYQVGNFGKSGATLLQKGHRPYMQQEEYWQAIAFQPDIVVISLGLNDTDPRNWPNYRDDFISDYMELAGSFTTSKGVPSKVYITLMTPIFHPHPRFKSGTRDWFWQIQEAIVRVARNTGAQLVDLHTPLYSYPNLFPDALHPTARGAAIIAKTVYGALTDNFGGLQPHRIFTSNMVLQRDRPIPVWGTANSGQQVEVELNGEKVTAIADAQGRWKVQLPAMPAGGPYTLHIEDDSDQYAFDNILVGEVWLCSGQSNMEFPLKVSKNGSSAIPAATNTDLRLLHYKPIAQTSAQKWDSTTLVRLNNLDVFEGQWEINSPQSAGNFSAIGWYFGNHLANTLGVPVGIIQMAVGGSPAEAWIDRKTLEFSSPLVDILYDWRHNDRVMQWCRERADLNLSHSDNPLQRHPFEPAYLFEAGLSQLTEFPVKGILWYQGESNAHNVELHEMIFPTLVKSWREAWGQPDLPFYFAQLSSLNRPSWPHFRDSQRRLAKQIPHTQMIVTSDLGDSLDVHPVEKQPVGTRFAYSALKNLYHIDEKAPQSPAISNIEQQDGEIAVTFNHAKKLMTSDDKPVRELEIAGSDGIFVQVKGQLTDNKLIIRTNGKSVKAIRYGWRPFSKGNLVNEEGLPASTFHEDIASKQGQTHYNKTKPKHN